MVTFVSNVIQYTEIAVGRICPEVPEFWQFHPIDSTYEPLWHSKSTARADVV